MHSERGMPNVMNYEVSCRPSRREHLWPHNDMWGLHDFCLEGAQGAASYLEMVEKAFGPSENAEQFSQYAQWINYDGYRGIFERRVQARHVIVDEPPGGLAFPWYGRLTIISLTPRQPTLAAKKPRNRFIFNGTLYTMT